MVRFHLTALFKILKTCPSASHAKQLLAGMQQNKTPEKITQSVLCPKMCNFYLPFAFTIIHGSGRPAGLPLPCIIVNANGR